MYYHASKTRATMRISHGPTTDPYPAPGATQDEVYYLLGDHLGSTTVTVNSDGSVKAKVRYDAWGKTRSSSGTTPTDRKYTGQIEEATVGLYFYNARWYDPALGRFIQADTIIPQSGSPLAWDRYAYTNNNPINYYDPSGHRITDGCSYEGCSTKHPDWIEHTFLIGTFPIALKYSTVSYGDNAEQSSCGGCSMEPYVKIENSRVAGIASASGLINDTIIGVGNKIVDSLPPAIFVNLNYFENPDGGLYIDSLNITNKTGGNLFLSSLSFMTRGSPDCSNCVYGTGGDYGIIPGPSIRNQNSMPSIGPIAQPEKITTIDLVPSNYSQNNYNHFYPYEQVTVFARMVEYNSGRYYPTLEKTLARIKK